jgi:hypothetical protein
LEKFVGGEEDVGGKGGGEGDSEDGVGVAGEDVAVGGAVVG